MKIVNFKEIISKSIGGIRSVYFVCGFGLSSWAPLVPFAKERLALDEAGLGLLLLLLGAGAIIMMPISGILGQRYGNRIVIALSSLLLAIALPFLAFLDSRILMGLSLFLFGAGVGTVDVAMNSVGVHIQNLHSKPIMSSFHGLFSLGGLFGSIGVGILLKMGLEPLVAAICISILVIATVGFQYNKLFDKATEKATAIKNDDSEIPKQAIRFSWLHPGVLFFGILCFIVFMVEGAVLDWSALYLRENRGMNEVWAGLGFATFSVAMAIMRLLGDRIVEKLSSVAVVTGGSLIAALGLILVIMAPTLPVSIAGFFILGCGAANIVPVFFNEAGRLKGISTSMAVSAISTLGYSGMLLGPVGVGLVAQISSLATAFAFAATLLAGVGVLYLFYISAKKNKKTNNL
ncbi:MFS transporter [Flavobacterium sp. LS1R47]|uniref:MFS transporter n=1 Tax=Flavobacterium frigoritolerans TaxID=2987686 RepID=A0A9X3HMJ0_9FLAO|nr:MFS transporter [Flavobacterium frigoritolerans]MCV9934117.1 MFS transporter [Flavobacterium frigoritolerans]